MVYIRVFGSFCESHLIVSDGYKSSRAVQIEDKRANITERLIPLTSEPLLRTSAVE